MYPVFNGLQANGHLAFCGEALSAHHAWISGAWASAYMQMMAFLKDRGQDNAVAKLTTSTFGGGSEPGSYHPEEMDESLFMHLLHMRQKEWSKTGPGRVKGEGSGQTKLPIREA